MKTAIMFPLFLLSAWCYAQDQQLSGRYTRFNLQGTNRFDVRSYSGPDRLTFNSNESHSISGELGYGWFYKNKKSLYFGAGAAVGYDYTRVTRQWNNAYFGVIQKTSYKNMYNNLVFFSFAQRMEYAYSFNRIYSSDQYYQNLSNPTSKTHHLTFGLKPGVLYRYNKSASFTLELDFLSVSLQQNKYAASENTRLNYTLFSNYNIASILVGFLWSPTFIQSKKANDF